MRHQIHACDGIRVPFDMACDVLDRSRHDILDRATRQVMVAEPAESPRVVTAALEREGDRCATLAAHWIQPDATAVLEGGQSAWLHCNLRLIPRQAGDHRLTEVLLTASCETSPRNPDSFNDDLCARFLHEVAVEVERKAADRPTAHEGPDGRASPASRPATPRGQGGRDPLPDRAGPRLGQASRS